MAHLKLYDNTDNCVELNGLKDSVADTFINNATVTCRVLSTSLAEIVASFALAYVASSNGIYRGTVPDTAPFTPDQALRLEFIADGGAGKRGEWLVPAVVQTREF